MKSGCKNLDCKQSLSFPSVFLAFLRASIKLSSSEPQSHELRDADVEEEAKERTKEPL